MIEHRDISFSTDGYVICKGVKLPLTREQALDYQTQTGMDAITMVEWSYNNNISVIRDKRIDEILMKLKN